ncbi:MAG: GNAT family N-acetyltransferase [Granulosicoccus sp.]|nr:GNAT family N-acetyltransferase [Granulosicoccus sp.]
MTIETRLVDYSDSAQGKLLVELLNAYALDPMGGAEPLPASTQSNLVASLHATPGAFSLIAYVDDVAAGLTNCFTGFSTFKCKPLINIHDIAVLPQYRAQGIGQALLLAVERIALEKGCCKLTLEVLQGNLPAKKAYEKFGFAGYELDPELGQAELWQKFL